MIQNAASLVANGFSKVATCNRCNWCWGAKLNDTLMMAGQNSEGRGAWRVARRPCTCTTDSPGTQQAARCRWQGACMDRSWRGIATGTLICRYVSTRRECETGQRRGWAPWIDGEWMEKPQDNLARGLSRFFFSPSLRGLSRWWRGSQRRASRGPRHPCRLDQDPHVDWLSKAQRSPEDQEGV
jgi:hypothetical protein